MRDPKCRCRTNRQTCRIEKHLHRLRAMLRFPERLDKRPTETDQHGLAKAEQSDAGQKQDEAAEAFGIPSSGHDSKYRGSKCGDYRDIQFGFSGHRLLPTANLRRSAHFSPSIMMFNAVDVVWFVALPQTAPVPQTTLVPVTK